MNGRIDFHTHAFPDHVAAKAIPALEAKGGIKAALRGTVDDLLRSMDRAAIDRSVICSIATRPEQFQAILDWSKQIRSERIIPLPSVHPQDPDLIEHIHIIHEQGFPGIKLHPYYQDFFMDEARLSPLYEALINHNLLLVMHTGYDIAFPLDRRCDPGQTLNVLKQHPELKLITTHFGAWKQWEDVQEMLIGKPIYMELSFALDFLDRETARQMLLSHPPEYLLFGSDSPWTNQKQTLDLLEQLDLDPDLLQSITRDNAARLLGLER